MLGIPPFPVPLPQRCANNDYERLLGQALLNLRSELGIEAVVAGDIHLADVRAYHAKLIGSLGLTLETPLFGEDTVKLARELSTTLAAVTTSVDLSILDESFLGRAYDSEFIAGLPPDPCGENGEFHTFVNDMPGFPSALPIAVEGTRCALRLSLTQLSLGRHLFQLLA